MTDALVASIAVAQLKADEGFSSHVYRCPAGALTIGYGRNVDPDAGGPGVSEGEAALLLGNDVAACEIDLSRLFPGWDSFTVVRRACLINLRFQLGPSRFRGFRRMIAAIQAGDWFTASRELANSALMTQVPERTSRRVRELEVG